MLAESLRPHHRSAPPLSGLPCSKPHRAACLLQVEDSRLMTSCWEVGAGHGARAAVICISRGPTVRAWADSCIRRAPSTSTGGRRRWTQGLMAGQATANRTPWPPAARSSQAPACASVSSASSVSGPSRTRLFGGCGARFMSLLATFPTASRGSGPGCAPGLEERPRQTALLQPCTALLRLRCAPA